MQPKDTEERRRAIDRVNRAYGKRVEYVFERYGELYINASDEELVRQGKRTYGEELTRLYDLDLSGWRVIGHYGCGRGYEGRSWYDMGKPFGRR